MELFDHERQARVERQSLAAEALAVVDHHHGKLGSLRSLPRGADLPLDLVPRGLAPALVEIDAVEPALRLRRRELELAPARRHLRFADMLLGHAIGMEQPARAAADLARLQTGEARERADAQIGFLFGKGEKQRGDGVQPGDLVQKLAREGGFPRGGRADQQVQAGGNAVQRGVERGEARAPAGDLSDRAAAVEAGEKRIQRRALGFGFLFAHDNGGD